MKSHRTLYILLLVLCHTLMVEAVAYMPLGSGRYDDSHPLIYEDSWTKWPYSFINESGEPDGFNVELTRIVMERLDIPYSIRLVNQHKVYNDMKNDSVQLTIGVAASYNSEYGHFGKAKVCSFNNVMFVHKSDSTGKIPLHELRHRPFVVRITSSAYHYLHDNGFPDSTMTIVDDMEAEVLKEASNGTQGAIWEQMLMRWILKKYHLEDRYTLVPVDIPSFNYTYMSKDEALLSRIDSVCLELQKDGTIDLLREKWMDTGRVRDEGIPIYLPLIVGGCTLLVVLLIVLLRIYRRYYTSDTLKDIRAQMELVIDSNNIRVWVYYPLMRHYAWMTSDGNVAELYSSFEFSKFYPDDDFNIIHQQVMDFLSEDHDPVVKTLRSYDLDMEKILDVEVHMEELKDEYGKIYLICGVQHDITHSKAHIDRMRLLRERYLTAMDIAFAGVMRFDKTGRLIGINQRLCVKMGISDVDEVISHNYNIKDFGVFEGMDFENCPNDFSFCAKIKNSEMSWYMPFAHFSNFNPDPEEHPDFYTSSERHLHDSRIPEYGYYHLHVVKSCDSEGNTQGYLIFILDITKQTNKHKLIVGKKLRRDQFVRENETYRKRMAYTLMANKIWTLNYDMETRELSIRNTTNNKIITFSQLRVLELIDSKDMKKIFRIFRRIESGDNNDIHTVVTTLLYNEAGLHISYCFDIHPLYDNNGRKNSYFGICRDITDELHAEAQLKKETAKAREAEHLKQMFLKNMSYSIRQPLMKMQQTIKRLAEEASQKNEQKLLKSITGNTQRLITLSDDTLLLSRIEAGLRKPVFEDVDIVALFDKVVNKTFNTYTNENVSFKLENTYSTLTFKTDRSIMERIVREAVALSARYMGFGKLTVRYMLRKDMFSIVVEDNGQGIPPSVMQNLFESRLVDSFTSEEHNYRLSGLEMPICKALVNLLGGTIDIESEPGHGTSTYITIPQDGE